MTFKILKFLITVVIYFEPINFVSNLYGGAKVIIDF